MSSSTSSGYTVDPDNPMAPPAEVWDAMTPEERAAVVDSLPIRVPIEVMAPEGDHHRDAKNRTLDTLDTYFKKIGRRVYLSSELAVYYPGQPRIVPDVLAVVDVDPHPRNSWIVSDECKGLDWVLEVHVAGKLSLDANIKPKVYAQLGIPEYFFFDRGRNLLRGYRLPNGSAAVYQPLIPQQGLYHSNILDLDLALEGGKLRFYHGSARLTDSDELVRRLETTVGDLVEARVETEGTIEELKERAEEEAKRAEVANARIAELEAELSKLRSQ